MADDVAILGLGVDSSAAVNGMKNFTREVGGMTSAVKTAALALTSLFATAKITQFINGTSAAFASYGDQMAKMSQRLDIAASKLSEMSYIASQSGTSIESFERAVRLLQRNLTSADEEAKTATAAFEKLGLSIQELKQMSPDEQFKAVASAIASLESPSERTAYAMKIFSRSGAELIPFFQQGREGMDKLSEKARKLGIVMSDQDYQAAVELTDAMDTFNRSISAVRNAIVSGLAPTLTEIYEKISSSAGAVVGFVRENKEFVTSLVKLGVAGTAVGALAGAYGVLKTALMAQSAIRATLAAAKAKQIAATQADTAATIANTQAHLANNAATGAGVAATGANAASKGGIGIMGKLAKHGGVIALGGAMAVMLANSVYKGFRDEATKSGGQLSNPAKTIVRSLGFNIKERWAEAEKSIEPGFDKIKAVGNLFSLGVANAIESSKLGQIAIQQLSDTILGLATKIELVDAAVGGYSEELERQKQLDEQLAAVQKRRAAQMKAREERTQAVKTYADSDEWKDFQKEQDERRGRIGLTGMDLENYDISSATQKAEDTRAKLRDAEARRQELESKVEAAKLARDEQSIKVDEENDRYAEDSAHAVYYQGPLNQLKDELVQRQEELEKATQELDSFLSGEFKNAQEEEIKSAEEFAAASEQFRNALAEDESRKREERQAETDTKIRSDYAGMGSDEATAARAKAESDVMKNRLSEMNDAVYEIKILEDQLANETNQFEKQNLLENLELQKGIAGTLQERLELQAEIDEKNAEEQAALRRIAEQEQELNRTREERNKSLGEHAQSLAENYATKWMNDSEKVQYQRGKLATSMANAESFGYREQKITEMDEMIKRLGERASQGGDAGRGAEEEMNRLIKERAEAEEQLYADKKQTMDDQYAALGAIDDIAGSKASQYMQDYQKEMEGWNEAEKKDRQPVAVQKAVDAASAEGFAQLNKVYDTSQKKIEDHTKNIKEYTRQMKQYLMQLAAQGDTSWALDVEGA